MFVDFPPRPRWNDVLELFSEMLPVLRPLTATCTRLELQDSRIHREQGQGHKMVGAFHY